MGGGRVDIVMYEGDGVIKNSLEIKCIAYKPLYLKTCDLCNILRDFDAILK